jgi:tRNA pseudouridine55 synthase
MFGLLNINKPSGVTSRDVVNRVQHLVRPIKVGHAGTLDPLATGVLVVCLGSATRLVEYVQRMKKSYRGTFLLGRESETEDVEGDVSLLATAPIPSRNEIEATLKEFIGQIEQRPPAYSALKVKGQRAYALARNGQTVDLKARPVEVHDLRLVEYAYPTLTLDVCCGSGTYIRSLGRDIAQRLGTGAVMSALDRTAIGPFLLDTAIDIDALVSSSLESAILPPALALVDLQRICLDDNELAALAYGKKIADRFEIHQASEVAGVNDQGELVAVLQKCAVGFLQPKRNFIGR